MTAKTRHCDECVHWNGKHHPDDFRCKHGHKPRYHLPRNPIDANWGFKRKCEDFQEKKQ